VRDVDPIKSKSRPKGAEALTADQLRDLLVKVMASQLGAPDVTSHSFRKTVATLIDDDGLSARIGADHLGHANVSMTQDRYMARGQVHSQVAELLDRAITMNKRWMRYKWGAQNAL
jgi:integrase